jgi:hypothetical protein
MNHEVSDEGFSEGDALEYVRDLVLARAAKDPRYGNLTPEQFRCFPYETREAIRWVFHHFDKMSDPLEREKIITDDTLVAVLGLEEEEIDRLIKSEVIHRIGETALEGEVYQLNDTYRDHWMVRRMQRVEVRSFHAPI